MRFLMPVSFVTTLLLAACGGGNADPAQTVVPGSGADPTPTPTATAYAPDLKSFATAWVALNLAAAVPDLLHITGNTGACGGGGSTAYDLGSVKQTATGCTLKASPDNAYTGTFSATFTTSGNSRNITLSDLAVTAFSPGASSPAQFVVSAGAASGADDFSSDTSDVFSGLSFSLDATPTGSSSAYHVASNAAATLTQTYQNGVASVLIQTADIGVTRGSGAWRFTVQGIGATGDARPDRGILQVSDSGNAAAGPTTVAFSSDNTLSFSTATGSVTKHWADADVQAALAAARG